MSNITESTNDFLQIALTQAKASYEFSQKSDNYLRTAKIYKFLEVLETCKDIKDLDCFIAATEIFRQANEIFEYITDAYRKCTKFCDVVCIGKVDEVSSENGFVHKEINGDLF